MQLAFEEIFTDVLVVGSGSAGTMASIKAKLAGADVLVVTKGPWPSGNSTKALAGFAAAFGHANPADNPDVHFADVVRNGVGLCNQKLVHKWVNEICPLTEEMVGWGLDLVRNGDKYHQIPWEGHTYPRMVNHHRVTGKYLMKCLGDKAEALGIRALSHTIIGGLLKSGDHVAGAWAINYRTGQAFIIHCKAVIMCTGGFGALYPYGDNVGAVTGEGYAQAFNAGAEVLGMEFGHFLTSPVYPEKMQVKFVFVGFVNGLLNESNARLYNGRGERFMFRYFPEQGERRHKGEILTRCISQEILEGRGGAHGGIYFDASDVPDEFRNNDRYRRIYELADRAGMDLRREPIELITYPHDLVGGIKMDENARTNVPGLYAAGEATGGSHGASRFGGSALSDCLVFGAVGGTDAADYARKLGRHLPLDKAGVAAVHDKVRRWLSNEGLDPGEVLSELSAIAFRDLNMVRNEPGLNRVKDRMNDMRKSVLPKMSARGSNEKETFDRLRKAIESEGQTDLCDIIAHAALDRRESRGGFFGGHYRTEYPERDDNEWLKNIVLSKNGNGIKIAHEAPVQLGALSDEIKSVMATEWRPPNSLEYYAEAE